MDQGRLTAINLVANAVTIVLLVVLLLRPTVSAADLPSDTGFQVDQIEQTVQDMSTRLDRISSAIGGGFTPNSGLFGSLNALSAKVNDIELNVQSLCDRLDAC